MVLRAFLGTFAALVVPAVALAQNPQSTPVSRPPITLRAGDVLKVRVWPDSVLSGQFTVEDNGVVVLPELGDVLIAGKDIRDIQTMLRELYGRVRKSAIVHVSPIFRVGVLGQVQRPGLYAAEPTMTWFDIISLAGGFTDRAARDRVTVVRDGRELLINTVASDLALASSLSVEVRSGDKVIVPQRRGWNWITALGVAQFVAIMASLALQARR